MHERPALNFTRSKRVSNVAGEKKPVHFVYDVFTDRRDQKSPFQIGSLADSETLFVTSTSTFPKVVGSRLAARQFRV